MITNVDITIFNACYEAQTRSKVFVPTVIRYVSLLVSDGVNTNDGIWTDQAVYKIRIPLYGSEIQNSRKYLPELQYQDAGGSDAWTIQKGDLVVIGQYSGEAFSLPREEVAAWAIAHCMKIITVTEYADNTIRGCKATKHWRIGGA